MTIPSSLSFRAQLRAVLQSRLPPPKCCYLQRACIEQLTLHTARISGIILRTSSLRCGRLGTIFKPAGIATPYIGIWEAYIQLSGVVDRDGRSGNWCGEHATLLGCLLAKPQIPSRP